MNDQIRKILMEQFSPEQILKAAEQFELSTEIALDKLLEELAEKLRAAYHSGLMPADLEELPPELLLEILLEIRDPKELLKACGTSKRLRDFCQDFPELKERVKVAFRRDRYERYYEDYLRKELEYITLQSGLRLPEPEMQGHPNVLNVYSQKLGNPQVATVNGFIDYYMQTGNFQEIVDTADQLIEENVPENPDFRAFDSAFSGLSALVATLAPTWIADPEAKTMILGLKTERLLEVLTDERTDPLYKKFPIGEESVDPPYSKAYIQPRGEYWNPRIVWDFEDFKFTIEEDENRAPTKEDYAPLWKSLREVEKYYGVISE